MAEKNYTIPINEAFDVYDGCPVCRLAKTLDERNVDYILGAAMMEPDVRIETNRLGFCRRHYTAMLEMGNRLGLALILESYLAGIKEKLASPPHKKRSALDEATQSCFVCDRAAGTMERYADNIVYLWRTESYFREKFARQPHVCLNHAALLLRVSAQTEPKRTPKGATLFADAVRDAAHRRFDVVSDEISRFCKSFDYRNADMPIGEAGHAVEHAIEWVLGE